MYETHGTGLPGPSWEREIDLQRFGHEVSRYWAGTPNQHRPTNRLYRRMRIDAAQRERSRNNGERFLEHRYGCVPRAEVLTTAPPRCFPTKPTFGTRATKVCGGLGRSTRARPLRGYIWCAFWMTRGLSSFLLLRRVTRLRQERYEFLGVYKYT